MSINHFSPEFQETLWWSTQHQKPSTATTTWPYHHQHHQGNNWPKPAYDHHDNRFLNNNPLGLNLNFGGGDDEEVAEEKVTADDESCSRGRELEDDVLDKEHLFEKPLTPSDVGKLNRLVIPKQHAEKYFPLGVDSGLLLTFEDESGKCWRFRYSYWSSSQSYVLTKGWSRYVKEKKLDAGDVILFDRHRVNADRLFIGWRRRGAAAESKEGGVSVAPVQPKLAGTVGRGGSGGGGWTGGFYSAQYPYPTHQGHGPSVPERIPTGSDGQSLPTGNSRRLRLFGVNLECQLDDSEPLTPEDSSISSQGLPLFSQSPYSSLNLEEHHHQTNITFYQDVNHNHYHHRNMRDGRG